MHSWEVVCIEVDDDSSFSDCRAISQIGYKAPSLKKKDSNNVSGRIRQGHSDYHILVDGRRVPLESAKDPDVHLYVRTMDEDTTDDPLLQLESCSSLELSKRFE
jgi:hypothetical protein